MSARVELRRLTDTAVWAPTTGAGRTGRGGDRQPRYSGRGSGSGRTTTPRSQHGTAGSGPHLRGSPTLRRAEPTYGRSRPWPVSRVLRPSTWGWTSTRTRSRWGSCRPTNRSQMSSGSPMTRHRSAGSPAASATPACCEPATSTGPTGFELARLLHSMGISCQVIAPSLIPKAPGRQGPRPTGAIAGGSPRLHRAGELVAIRIPTVQEEAVRDLCRTRADMVQDLTRARNRLGKFLLRHRRVWRGGATWTLTRQAWLGSQRLDQPAMAQTVGHDLAVVEVRNAQLDAVAADLAAGATGVGCQKSVSSRCRLMLMDQSTEEVAPTQPAEDRSAPRFRRHRRPGRHLPKAAVRTVSIVVLDIGPQDATLVSSRSPPASSAGTASAAWCVSIGRSQHGGPVSEPYGQAAGRWCGGGGGAAVTGLGGGTRRAWSSRRRMTGVVVASSQASWARLVCCSQRDTRWPSRSVNPWARA